MNLCFIYLQNTKTRLQTINKQCVCDGYVHMECINEWYNHSANCPICRKAPSPKEDINVDAIVYMMYFITVFIIVFIL